MIEGFSQITAMPEGKRILLIVRVAKIRRRKMVSDARQNMYHTDKCKRQIRHKFLKQLNIEASCFMTRSHHNNPQNRFNQTVLLKDIL